MSDFSFFLPISKVEAQADGSRLVSGYASTPTKDLDGEIVSLDAIKSALPAYWEWRNIRQMHQANAVGRAQEANIDGDGLFLTAKIVEEGCIKLIDEKVLQGFSIGGKKLAKKGDTITELELIEISVVDRPANPDCRFTALGKSASPGIGILTVEQVRANLGVPPINDSDLVITAAEAGPLRKLLKWAFGKGGDAPGEGDKPYGSVEYADPGFQSDGKKRYPIDTEEHIRAAWSYINKPKNAAQYSAEQLSKIKAKIVAAWKAKIDKDGPPSAADKAALIASLKKYDGNEVMDSASALHAIQCLQDLLQWEGEEDDGEDGQIAAIKTAIEALKAFVASEIQEKPGDDGEGDAGKAASGSPFDEIKEHLQMANLDEIFARMAARNDVNKRGASGMHKGMMTKAAHHLGKMMECAKAAHGHFGKAAGCMMDHVKAMKSADAATLKKAADGDHVTTAMGHMAAGNAKMEEMQDHGELAQHYMGKAAGAEGGPGESVGGGATDTGQGSLTEGGVPEYDAHNAYPGKAASAGYTKEIVDALVAAAAKAANAEGQLEIMKRMPATSGPRAARFAEIGKAFAPGTGAGDQPNALEALFKDVNINPGDPEQAKGAATTMIANMYRNPRIFAKSVSDPSFHGTGGVRH